MKNFFVLGLCLFISFNVYSQNVQPAFPQLVSSRFSQFLETSLHEKVYLHTDKPYYSAGENIWFKSYLVNAATHYPQSPSQFLYVELIDRSDSVFSRVKIRKDSLGFFAGCFALEPEMPAGNYAIRAYTYWMQNAGADYFFCKDIYIGNSIDDRISSEITYGTPLNGKVQVNVKFTNIYHAPIANKPVIVAHNWNAASKRSFVRTTNADGKINWAIMLDTTRQSKKYINVSFGDPSMKFNKRFFVPEFSTDFDVQFFPESGVLLDDNPHIVAFKAIGANGLSVDVAGKVFTSGGEEVAEFSSVHKGMGKFIVLPRAGENYYALVKTAGGIEKRFGFPAVQSQGVAFQLAYSKGKLHYEMFNNTSLANDALCLLIHCRGIAYVVQPLRQPVGYITESLLPNGILTFSVVDTLGNTYCERLCFVNNANMPVVSMESDRPLYRKRESVCLDFNIQNIQPVVGKPVAGTYSVSVTDSKAVEIDSLSDNILSCLLLTSDLKGYVEEPAAYFKGINARQRENVDLLMLTQGWRRFNTPDVLKGVCKSPEYYMEIGQALSGKVLNLLNRPVKKSDIFMLSSYKMQIRAVETDSLGRYQIDGIEFPDGTTFVLKARKKKNFGDVEIVPDIDAFPKPAVFVPALRADFITSMSDYLQQSREKYYTEGGTRVIGLDELTVKANRKPENSSGDMYSSMADTQIDSERLKGYPGMMIMDVIATVPGVQVAGNLVSIRGSSGNPLVLIDGIETHELNDLSYLSTDDVESIAVFKGADAAIFGARGGNGAISVRLKKGYVPNGVAPVSLSRVMPLGYQKPVEFYTPKYEVDSVRMDPKADLRTTIYWNPKLVADSLGNVHVNFYTADKANDYSVVFEGITEKGEICRYVGVLRRE